LLVEQEVPSAGSREEVQIPKWGALSVQKGRFYDQPRSARGGIEHGLSGLGATRLVTFGCGQTVEADRDTADQDRVAVSNEGDLASRAAARTISGRGEPGEHQEKDDQAQDAAVHDVLRTNVQVEGIDSSYTGTSAMAIVPLPLPPGAEARALLHRLLEHADIIGTDTMGRTFILLAVEGGVLERLMTFDADAAELEPEPDDEEDGPPHSLDLVPRKLVSRRRVIPFAKAG
jgi:hypothetical protein